MPNTLSNILVFIAGFVLSWLLLAFFLKWRTKRIVKFSIPYWASMKVTLVTAIVLQILILLANGIPYVVKSANVSGSGITFVVAILPLMLVLLSLFVAQRVLQRRLIKENLDEPNAKKISGSTISYFFWTGIVVVLLGYFIFATLFLR